VSVALGVSVTYASGEELELWAERRTASSAKSFVGSDANPAIVSVPLPLVVAGMVTDAITEPAVTRVVDDAEPTLATADSGTSRLGVGTEPPPPQPTSSAPSAKAPAINEPRKWKARVETSIGKTTP
jgi:hypothetical protein